jgi:ectoine hydroxylase-related dioxygenase (phytanoyl-CoA dioxygenase family)
MIDFDAHAAAIARDGYTIVENAIEPELRCALLAELNRLERDYEIVPSKNSFEGHHTVRIYNLLVHGKLFEQIPVHPNVLPVVERVLDPGARLSLRSGGGLVDPPGRRAVGAKAKYPHCAVQRGLTAATKNLHATA